MTGDELTARLAELTIAFGANVQPGQIVAVHAEPDHAPLVRAVAVEAYRRGARFVDVFYFDPYVKRARIAHAREDTLDFVPSWYGDRLLALGEQRCARVWISGATSRGLLDDLDPARAGRDLLPRLKETGKVVNDRTTNWTIVPYPSESWARQVHPDLPPSEALARLTDELGHVLRLDEPDPVAAWDARFRDTTAAAARLTEHRFDAIRFEGPGTDLTIGLLPSSRWAAATFSTVDGLEHKPNLPSEEVFTTPDPLRADGHVTATKPLVFSDGSVVSGLRVRFEGGRAVEIDADEGAANLRARVGKDEGGARLGEVALVDREGRIGPLDTVFYDTLLDENAASHIALGSGFGFAVEADDDKRRVNVSSVHVDFMIGGDAVAVTGITGDGAPVPVLRAGSWRI
ncbi:MAG TPA: aminopeptidase [Gaiellaceae bacterium]|nr:aminopeptidase [Gaiellaceae bacterium]